MTTGRPRTIQRFPAEKEQSSDNRDKTEPLLEHFISMFIKFSGYELKKKNAPKNALLSIHPQDP
jgi:hypothetical protein